MAWERGAAPVAIAIVLLSTVAGCLGSGEDLDPSASGEGGLPEAGDLRCVPRADGSGSGQTCNHDTLIEPAREGNEPTVAANPTDPDNVVAGAKDYYPESAGECAWDGIYHTTDGGEAWNSRSLPGSPWQLLNNRSGFEANPTSQYWCSTDPVVAFGPNGTLYYSFLAYQGDPVTASAVGKEATCAAHEVVSTVPCSGANDVVINRGSVGVMISHDGGETISDTVLIDSGTFPANLPDRQWIAVDQESGTVYVAWTQVFLPGNAVYRSTDGGQSWEGPTLLNELPVGGATIGPVSPPHGLFTDTGPGDTVYVSGCGPDGPYLAESTDGGESFTDWQRVVEAEDEGMEASYRSGQVCMVAADETDGPHRGNVYLVYSATPNGDRDVFAVRSTDGGQTWSDPVQLNRDDSGNDQFFPTVSVNPNGVVDVAWYDRRHDPDNRLLDVYHRTSLDGAQTFSQELRVTTNSSDPTHSKHQGGFTFIGDYIDIDATTECAWPVWVDTRHQKADVMTTCIQRPGSATEPDPTTQPPSTDAG